MWLRTGTTRAKLHGMSRQPAASAIRHAIRHKEAPPARVLRFPSTQPEWDVGQSFRHLRLCAILHEILRTAVGDAGSFGGDQFVYYDAANPKQCLAPDGFVKLGVPQEDFTSWRVWDKGAPDLAVEVLSPSDTAEPITLEEKLGRYGSLGVRELVFFDVDAPEGARLRAWDRLEDVLVEREVVDERTPCLTLGGLFLLAPAEDRAVALRLSRDAEGLDLVPLATELSDALLAASEATLAHKEAELAAVRAEREAERAELARLRAELAGRPR